MRQEEAKFNIPSGDIAPDGLQVDKKLLSEVGIIPESIIPRGEGVLSPRAARVGSGGGFSQKSAMTGYAGQNFNPLSPISSIDAATRASKHENEVEKLAKPKSHHKQAAKVFKPAMDGATQIQYSPSSISYTPAREKVSLQDPSKASEDFKLCKKLVDSHVSLGAAKSYHKQHAKSSQSGYPGMSPPLFHSNSMEAVYDQNHAPICPEVKKAVRQCGDEPGNHYGEVIQSLFHAENDGKSPPRSDQCSVPCFEGDSFSAPISSSDLHQNYSDQADYLLLSEAGILQQTPKTVAEAMLSGQKNMWIAAMTREKRCHIKNKTFGELCPAGKNVKAIPADWIFKIKHRGEADNIDSIEQGQYKARIVLRGQFMKPGLDYNDAFSPVAKTTTIRALLAVAAKFDMELYGGDVETAFLTPDIDTEIWVGLPKFYGD
jgi:hypothetical protein